MAKTLKEELEDIAAPGMTDMRRVGKWLELLTAHVAALEARVVAPTQDTALSILTQENGHLRAENAALRERVATLEEWQAPKHDRQWPTPQPIETAPLDEILTYPLGNTERSGWARDWPGTGGTVESWRALLKKWGRTHWLPMPPPPGGGK